MYLVPIVEIPQVSKEGLSLVKCWLLLERNGTHLMSVSGLAEAAEFAAENGLTLEKQTVCGDIIFQKVSPTVALTDFYTWAEVAPGQQPMREAWRPFVWSWPDLGCNEALKAVEIGPYSVGAVLEKYFSNNPNT